MTLSKDILMQFVDGELAPHDASRIEAEIAKDAEARAFVEMQTALRQQFQGAFAPVMEERPPDKLMAAIAETPVSWRWRLKQQFARRNSWMWMGLPAAGALALGLVIGIAVNPSNVGPIGTVNGTLVAQGRLADALNTRLASDTAHANGPQIGISFRAKDGHDCRTFATNGVAGIACRGEASWNVAALSAAPAETSGTYHMAGSGMPDLIRNAAENMIEGAPFDAAAERQARDRGWK